MNEPNKILSQKTFVRSSDSDVAPVCVWSVGRDTFTLVLTTGSPVPVLKASGKDHEIRIHEAAILAEGPIDK